jgi:xylulokinase
VLPYFAGERTPLFDPRARGLISGLTLSHGRGHLYRAMLEATAYGVRHIFEFMRDAGGGGKRLVAVGGGTKGGLWTQIVSDVTGRPQDLPEQTIGASYGDGIYDELYGIYRELYPATREQVHKLADMQKGGADVVT